LACPDGSLNHSWIADIMINDVMLLNPVRIVVCQICEIRIESSLVVLRNVR
jgi:hypothetical protein